MKQLYVANQDIRNGKNYIYGAGKHAAHMGKWFDVQGIPYEGFVYVSGNKKVPKDKKIITLEQFKEMDDANLLITQNRWQEVYDRLWSEIDEHRIYVNSTWYREEGKCIMCDNTVLFSTDAEFLPFLVERMFGGINKSTKVMHCPRCRCYYSLYRPSDAEMDLLYSGYRGQEYLEQRSRYESYYTAEFNRELYAPADGGRERKNRIWDFVRPYIDKDRVRTVLDFGGDEGQFIPDEFSYADRYVYEISGNKVADGVTLLKTKEELTGFSWDLIFCNMVMEHLSDPRTYFKELAMNMSKHTLLYIEVPVEKHMENSDFVLIHEHINFFREEVFRFWAEENALRIIKASSGGILQVLFSR